jgi:hypothetical protein
MTGKRQVMTITSHQFFTSLCESMRWEKYMLSSNTGAMKAMISAIIMSAAVPEIHMNFSLLRSSPREAVQYKMSWDKKGS